MLYNLTHCYDIMWPYCVVPNSSAVALWKPPRYRGSNSALVMGTALPFLRGDTYHTSATAASTQTPKFSFYRTFQFHDEELRNCFYTAQKLSKLVTTLQRNQQLVILHSPHQPRKAAAGTVISGPSCTPGCGSGGHFNLTFKQAVT